MSKPVPTSRTIHFENFEFEFRSSELREQGRKVKVQGQPVQILAMLLEQPGELVTRDEIKNELWPGDTFVDFEHSLNAAVKRLRQALHDSAENPRFVETLARRGYRFIAPVAWDVEQVERKDRRPIYGAAAIIALTLLATVVYFAMKQRAVAAPTNAINAVAILPF